MKKKVAINGFGRIGRLVFRAYLERADEFNEIFLSPSIILLMIKNF